MAELDYPRTTGPGGMSVGITSSSMLPSSILPSSYSTAATSSMLPSSIGALGISSSISNHALTHLDSNLAGLTANMVTTNHTGAVAASANHRVLDRGTAANSHQINSTIPPICQVCIPLRFNKHVCKQLNYVFCNSTETAIAIHSTRKMSKSIDTDPFHVVVSTIDSFDFHGFMAPFFF